MTGIILAGGQATRLGGVDKALLTIGGTSFLDRLLATLRPYCGEVLVAANDPAPYAGRGIRVVPDEEPGRGPLMGLLSGLTASSDEGNFVTAVDTPLLLPALVERLACDRGERDALVPVWNGWPEPLCAVYSKRCISHIRRCIGQGRIVSFFRYANIGYLAEETVRGIDPRGASFLNVNSPDDLQAAEGLWAEAGS